MIFFNGSVVLPSCIDIFVSQHIRDQVDIPGLPVKPGPVRAAKFMGRDLFQGRYDTAVFSDQVLHSPDCDPPVLQGKKKRVLMTVFRDHGHPLLHVILQGAGYFPAKIYDRLITAFTMDFQGPVFEINILQVQADAFRNTDPGAQQKGQQGSIPYLRFIMEAQLGLGQALAVLGQIQKLRDFLRVQADNGFFMPFGDRYQGSHILFDQFTLIEVTEHASERGQLAGLAAFVIGIDTAVLFIIAQILHIFFNIIFADVIEEADFIGSDRHGMQRRIVFMKKLKKDPQVIGIAQPCPGGGRCLNAPEILTAEGRKRGEDLPHFSDIFNILFFGIGFQRFVLVLHGQIPSRK